MKGMPPVYNLLHGQAMDKATYEFRVRWRGTKIPRGALVDGFHVAWTQGGLVLDTRRETVGTYERTVEFGGAGRDEHEMIIATNFEVTVDGAGYTVEKIRG